jgi:diacylglycerol kinase (ATP)
MSMEPGFHPPADMWYLIVNPNSGARKCGRDWSKIKYMLDETDLPYEFVLTEHKGHAIDLTVSALEKGYRNLAAVGGDGTLNEILNGVMTHRGVPLSEVTLGMIPVGTGNDWGRSFQIPSDYRKAALLLQRKKTTLQDIGKVTHQHHGTQEIRYFMNVAGMGYDALVAKKTNLRKEKGKGGPLTYFFFVFASLFQYRFMEAVIEVDGKTEFKGEIFSMNVGICKYNGGGMMQVPFADYNDGLLDVTLIKKAPKWIVVRYARKLFDGSLVDLPMVRTYRGRSIRIRSTGKVYLETDGESLGHTPFTFEILPICLRVVTGTP